MVLQLVGLVALVVGVWQVYTGWHGLAVFGFAVLWATTQLRVRKPRHE